MTARTPTDGHPYYCANCGAEYADWRACDLIECGPLETAADAQARAELAASVPEKGAE